MSDRNDARIHILVELIFWSQELEPLDYRQRVVTEKDLMNMWTHEANTQQKCYLWISQQLSIRFLRKDVKKINSSDLTDINIYIYNWKHSVSVSVLAYWKIACAVFNCTHESRTWLIAERFSLKKNFLLRKARVTWWSTGLCKMVIYWVWVCVCMVNILVCAWVFV